MGDAPLPDTAAVPLLAADYTPSKRPTRRVYIDRIQFQGAQLMVRLQKLSWLKDLLPA